MAGGAPTARDILQQQIARASEHECALKRTTRAVQKAHNGRVRSDAGLKSKKTWVLLRLIAVQSSMNPHAVLAARRLLPGGVWHEAQSIVEQEVRLRLLIDQPAVHAAATLALAVLPWKAVAVRAVRIIAELRLLKRIAEINSRGVAPSSKMVAEMLVQEWPAHDSRPRNHCMAGSVAN